MANQSGAAPLCTRCGMHRDANVHLDSHRGWYSGWHLYCGQVQVLSKQPFKIYIDRARAARLEPPIVVEDSIGKYYCSEVIGPTYKIKWARDNESAPQIWIEEHQSVGVKLA